MRHLHRREPGLLTVIAYVRAAPGKRDPPRSALEALVGRLVGRRATSTTTCTRASRTRTRFLYENWESGDDLDARLAAPHLQEFAAMIPDLLDGRGLTVNRVHRIG